MKNYLVLANFAGYDQNEFELFTNQWTVGSFDTLEECYEACRKDTEQVAHDTFESMYDETELKECEASIKEYVECGSKLHRTETDLLFFTRTLIYFLEFNGENFVNNIDYSVIKIK
jgi:hypothetical protein